VHVNESDECAIIHIPFLLTPCFSEVIADGYSDTNRFSGFFTPFENR
jgi:hypothetical protein